MGPHWRQDGDGHQHRIQQQRAHQRHADCANRSNTWVAFSSTADAFAPPDGTHPKRNFQDPRGTHGGEQCIVRMLLLMLTFGLAFVSPFVLEPKVPLCFRAAVTLPIVPAPIHLACLTTSEPPLHSHSHYRCVQNIAHANQSINPQQRQSERPTACNNGIGTGHCDQRTGTGTCAR